MAYFIPELYEAYVLDPLTQKPFISKLHCAFKLTIGNNLHQMLIQFSSVTEFMFLAVL